MSALVTEYRIAFIKWDHNRALVDAGHGPDGRPGVHVQTEAAYRLMDELEAGIPGSRSSRAAAAAVGSTWASWSTPTGSGSRTASTRTSGNGWSAGPG